MRLDEVITASDEAVVREVSGEIVLLNLASGMYFGLNDVGGFVWKTLGDTAMSAAHLCDTVEVEFDAPRDVIENDVTELIDQLLEHELVVKTSI